MHPGLPVLFKGEADMERRQIILFLLLCLAMSQQFAGGRSREHLPHRSTQAGQEEAAPELLVRAEMDSTDLWLEFIFPKGWDEYRFMAILLWQPNLGSCARSRQIFREKCNFHVFSPSSKFSWLMYLLHLT